MSDGVAGVAWQWEVGEIGKARAERRNGGGRAEKRWIASGDVIRGNWRTWKVLCRAFTSSNSLQSRWLEFGPV